MLLFFLLTALSAQQEEQFEIKSATIYYEHTESGFGSSIFYFDDFGAKKAIFTTIRSDSMNGEIVQQSYELFINNQRILPELGVRQLSESNEKPLTNSLISAVCNSKTLADLGYQEIGKSTILQQPCRSYASHSDTICLWSGLVLKSILHLSLVTMKTEAVRIDLGSPPDSVFQLKNFKKK